MQRWVDITMTIYGGKLKLNTLEKKHVHVHVPARTWLPSLGAKWQVLKFRLGDLYMGASYRGPCVGEPWSPPLSSNNFSSLFPIFHFPNSYSMWLSVLSSKLPGDKWSRLILMFAFPVHVPGVFTTCMCMCIWQGVSKYLCLQISDGWRGKDNSLWS